jgi:hypothetical protein
MSRKVSRDLRLNLQSKPATFDGVFRTRDAFLKEDRKLQHAHVTADDVALFASGRLAPPDLQRFLQQVASPCTLCDGRLRFYLPPSDSSLERHTALWAEELAGLSRLRERATRRSFERSYARFKHIARRVHGWARIEHLIELSRKARRRDPELMRLLAQGAASVAGTLGAREIDRERYTAGLKADLRARTQIELANAYRLHHRLAHAEQCLDKAAALIEEGCCSPRTRGRWMKVCASLLMEQGLTAEASRLLDRLHWFYVDCGEIDLAGRALISQGIALYGDDRRQEAAGALRRGFFSLSPE